LNYKAIGQMTGRRGSAFQDNFIAANRRRGSGNIDELFLFLPLPDDAVKVSVQVDGNQIAPEVIPISVTNTVALIDTRGKDIGRIEVLNSADEPLLLGPRMFAVPLDA